MELKTTVGTRYHGELKLPKTGYPPTQPGQFLQWTGNCAACNLLAGLVTKLIDRALQKHHSCVVAASRTRHCSMSAWHTSMMRQVCLDAWHAYEPVWSKFKAEQSSSRSRLNTKLRHVLLSGVESGAWCLESGGLPYRWEGNQLDALSVAIDHAVEVCQMPSHRMECLHQAVEESKAVEECDCPGRVTTMLLKCASVEQYHLGLNTLRESLWCTT